MNHTPNPFTNRGMVTDPADFMGRADMPAELAPDTLVATEFVCEYEESMRSACAGNGFFREYKGRRYCVLHYPSQEKVATFNSALQKKLEAKDFNFRGVWFPDVSFAGFQFSVTADFGRAVFAGDTDFSNTSFYEGVNFRYAKFTASTDFSGATFSAAANFFKTKFTPDVSFGTPEVSFTNANFKGPADFRFSDFNVEAYFMGTEYEAVADFNKATFRDTAYFGAAKFSANAIFSSAEFKGEALFFSANFSAAAKFQETIFNARADFSNSTFSADADFASATFSADADFSHSTFASYVRFAGGKNHSVFGNRSYLNLQHARIEKPERVSFHTLTLRSHWFVNVDARKFEFVNVELKPEILQDIKSLTERLISAPHRLLDIAYRRLAVNAEENHHYRDAVGFRYAAMDVRRQEEWRGMAFWRLAWWYWLLSGYGERITRAAGCLLLILILFAGLYTQVGFVCPADQKAKSTAMVTSHDTVGMPLRFTQVLVYSFEVSILQKPEPKPLTITARFLVGLETVLGPLQAALLALAIRRKFMR